MKVQQILSKLTSKHFWPYSMLLFLYMILKKSVLKMRRRGEWGERKENSDQWTFMPAVLLAKVELKQ